MGLIDLCFFVFFFRSQFMVLLGLWACLARVRDGLLLVKRVLGTTSFRYTFTMDLIYHPISICYRQILQHDLHFVLQLISSDISFDSECLFP